MALTKVPHGRTLHGDPCGLIHIRRQLFVDPVRTIEPTTRWACFHPLLDRRPQCLGNPPRLARCPVNLQALQAPFVIVLEPAPHCGAMHPQISGDGLALPPPVRHRDRLTPVTEASVIGRLEGVFQLFLFRCRQLNPPHLFQPTLLRNFTRGYLRKDATSFGACIREGTFTLATAEDTPLATLGHIGGNGANVASVHQPIMGTVRVGARLAPVLGFSHRPNLPSCSGVIHTDRKFGLFSFSKYCGVSTHLSGRRCMWSANTGHAHRVQGCVGDAAPRCLLHHRPCQHKA
jgi:hypothetical protein